MADGQCWAVNVKGHLHTFREALPTFNANPDGGVFIVTASIAVSPTDLQSRARMLRFRLGVEYFWQQFGVFRDQGSM
jgi:NAD(P)-dependent dehydrogenase (short-subunit alcohol dehydrogenase family)